MPKVIKNSLLQYIPKNFTIEKKVNPFRIFDANNNKITDGNVVYLCEREMRANDNFGLQFAKELSEKYNLPLKIIHQKIYYSYKPKQDFIDRQINHAKSEFVKSGLDFEIFSGENILNYLKELNTSVLIIDFNPINKRKNLKNVSFKVFEVDSHNIIPARFVSNKQEYNASTLRRKIYYNIYPFLTEYENIKNRKNEADVVLDDFIKNKLTNYAQFKNNPEYDALSGLSKYLNLGFISSQKVALEVIKSDVSGENKEAFLEELIVRKELSDNFCLYAENFKDFSSIPAWAKNSLIFHENDLRPYIYSDIELEQGKTHDKLWNATQVQLVKYGVIHGYLRMYWAKKIFEWTISPKKALQIAIYLNDKYAYDAPSANGYTSILWALGALHDRAFTDMPVTGKIRRMTYDSLKRKFDINKYIKKFSDII